MIGRWFCSRGWHAWHVWGTEFDWNAPMHIRFCFRCGLEQMVSDVVLFL
jgi:hypothetical protein